MGHSCKVCMNLVKTITLNICPSSYNVGPTLMIRLSQKVKWPNSEFQDFHYHIYMICIFTQVRLNFIRRIQCHMYMQTSRKFFIMNKSYSFQAWISSNAWHFVCVLLCFLGVLDIVKYIDKMKGWIPILAASMSLWCLLNFSHLLVIKVTKPSIGIARRRPFSGEKCTSQ